jgi:hypothetical protein
VNIAEKKMMEIMEVGDFVMKVVKMEMLTSL